jgi:hypothetical protein
MLATRSHPVSRSHRPDTHGASTGPSPYVRIYYFLPIVDNKEWRHDENRP